MGIETATLLAYAAVAGTGVAAYSAYSANQNASKTQDQAKKNADKAASDADQAFNAANGKKPDVGAMLSANEQAAKGGQGGTLLTGASGVDPSTLALGRSTLLGGG